MRNGVDGWELVEFLRFWEEEWVTALGRRERLRTEILTFTYEHTKTRERRVITRDVSNEPNSTCIVPIGFITKARFNVLVNELGERRARALLNGTSRVSQ